MHVDKYVVQNFGTRWTKGKSKKGQLLAVLNGEDISFKNLYEKFKIPRKTISNF